MSNTGRITTRKWVSENNLQDNLKQIILKRFDNQLPLIYESNAGFTIGFEYPWNVFLWRATKQRIEFAAPRTKWGWWVRSVIENELAIIYNGTITDEGVSEKWKGKSNKYPTFQDYFNSWLDGYDGHPIAGVKYMFDVEKQFIKNNIIRKAYNSLKI